MRAAIFEEMNKSYDLVAIHSQHVVRISPDCTNDGADSIPVCHIHTTDEAQITVRGKFDDVVIALFGSQNVKEVRLQKGE